MQTDTYTSYYFGKAPSKVLTGQKDWNKLSKPMKIGKDMLNFKNFEDYCFKGLRGRTNDDQTNLNW